MHILNDVLNGLTAKLPHVAQDFPTNPGVRDHINIKRCVTVKTVLT